MSETVYDQWKDQVRRVAWHLDRDWPDSDVEDIEQGIWEGLLYAQSQGRMLDPDAGDARSGLFFLGKRFCHFERKNHLMLSAQYGYRVTDVRNLFETFFLDKEAWYDACVPEDAESELANVGLEMTADLSRIWGLLSPPYREIIFRKFAMNESVETKRLQNALVRAADLLNTFSPVQQPAYVGARRVRSNAQAQFEIRTQT